MFVRYDLSLENFFPFLYKLKFLNMLFLFRFDQPTRDNVLAFTLISALKLSDYAKVTPVLSVVSLQLVAGFNFYFLKLLSW